MHQLLQLNYLFDHHIKLIQNDCEDDTIVRYNYAIILYILGKNNKAYSILK